MTEARVHELWIYPIKSVSGVRLSEARVEPRGFTLDRRWMVVDEDGVFLTQRRHPRLALGRVTLEADALAVRAEGVGALRLPLDEPRPVPMVHVRVWRDEVDALDCGDEAAAFFSELAGTRARLVRMPEATRRRVDPEYASPADVVSFADGFPYLFLSLASLDALNARLADKVPMRRFRPNVVLDGCEAFAEDLWGRVRVGDVPFRLAKPCARCKIVTIDPDTAVAAKEPLATLAVFRAGAAGGHSNKVYFGQNALAEGPGMVRTGDRVAVVDRRLAGGPGA